MRRRTGRNVEAILPALALLACPLIMGALMWMMSRSHRGPGVGAVNHEPVPSIDDLRAEQRRLASEIERLEAAGLGSEREHAADERVAGEGVRARS
jgi:hypothetical protein